MYTFASASPDNIKQWKCPEGKFIQNLSGHNAIVNCMAVNPEGVLVSGGDNGTMYLWDWRTGYNFQRMQVSFGFTYYLRSYYIPANIRNVYLSVTLSQLKKGTNFDVIRYRDRLVS